MGASPSKPIIRIAFFDLPIQYCRGKKMCCSFCACSIHNIHSNTQYKYTLENITQLYSHTLSLAIAAADPVFCYPLKFRLKFYTQTKARKGLLSQHSRQPKIDVGLAEISDE